MGVTTPAPSPPTPFPDRGVFVSKEASATEEFVKEGMEGVDVMMGLDDSEVGEEASKCGDANEDVVVDVIAVGMATDDNDADEEDEARIVLSG